jgi:NADH-quinone oxidoreductase subunit M
MANPASSLIPIALAVPLGGAVACAVLGHARAATVRMVALLITVVTLVLVAAVAALYPQARALQQAEEANKQPVVPARAAAVKTFEPVLATQCDIVPLQGGKKPTAIQFFVGLDGLNVWLVTLTAVLMVPSVLVSWNSITERVNEYYAWLLLLQVGMMGVFLAFDIILFYVFFELTLVPLFFLIGIWGGPQRQYAARKFFIYTLAGSLITLLGVLGVVIACYARSPDDELTFSIPRLVAIVQERLAAVAQDPGLAAERDFWRMVQLYVFLALMAGFAVKVPLVPLHTWLPLAHVEAPTAGSVLLAGVLLKIGTYGFLRLCLPLAPDAALGVGVPLVCVLAVIGIIYGALCSIAQDDIKKLVAYSSVSHLGLCMLGMFALNETGLAGSLIQMVNHGLSTGALFLLVGMLYDRYHTRMIDDYGGLAARLKLLGTVMVFICLSSVGLPGLNGFWGEALSLFGIASLEGAAVSGAALAVLGASGLVLGAWYLMTMLRRVFFGPVKEPHHEGHGPAADLNGRELAALAPIVLLCLVLGVYPQPFFDAAKDDLKLVESFADGARARAKAEQRKAAAPWSRLRLGDSPEGR